VPCLNMQGGYAGTCCMEDETCGGGKFSVGCPAGKCCDIAPYDPMGAGRTSDGSRLVRVTVVGDQTPP
jgi:hypothetical protein